MGKIYNRINWENYPSDQTPLNESNLGKLDIAMDTLDDQVITLNATKLDKATANGMVANVSFNEDNGIFTITYLSGATVQLDTKLEKLAVNFAYDAGSERLVITLDNGTKQYVDLSSLITEYEFDDTATIALSVVNGKVQATVKSGSITGDMLEPNYLANVQVAAGTASAAATSAEQSAAVAASAADVAVDSANEAAASEGVSEANARIATEKALEAAASTEAAMLSETNAKKSETSAKASELAAKSSENAASKSASTASTASTNALNSASISEDNAGTAVDASILATSYARGGTGTRAGEDTDNAYYYMQQAKAQTGGIPTKLSELENDMDFVTSMTQALAYYYKSSQLYTKEEIDGKISDIPKFSISVIEALPTENISATTLYLLRESETGSNKCSEWVYIENRWERIGDMDIDLSGYLTKTGDGSNLTETFGQAATLANIATGESHNTLFGKIAKAISALISHVSTAATASVLGHVKVDSALSSSSTNPVRNNAVHTALSGKLATTGDASNTTAIFTEAATYSNIQSGDKLSGIFGKIKKAISHIGNTDIGNIGDGTVTGGLFAINNDLGNCAFSVQEDGAYITYTPPGGADAVTKKLGSGMPTAVTLPYTASDDTIAVAFCSCLNNANVATPVTSTVAIRDMTTGTNLVTASSIAAGVTYSSIPGTAVVDLIAGHQYALVDVQNPPHSKYGYLYIIA